MHRCCDGTRRDLHSMECKYFLFNYAEASMSIIWSSSDTTSFRRISILFSNFLCFYSEITSYRHTNTYTQGKPLEICERICVCLCCVWFFFLEYRSNDEKMTYTLQRNVFQKTKTKIYLCTIVSPQIVNKLLSARDATGVRPLKQIAYTLYVL